MKFDFLRVICNHEHFIPLNLPFAVKGNYTYSVTIYVLYKIIVAHNYETELNDDFCRQHFLVGLLLKEVR